MSADATARLDFLFAAAHTLLPASPALSALYLDRFRRFANQRDVQLPEPVTRTFCPQCAALFVPGDKEQRMGCTVTVRSQTSDPRKKKKKKKNNKDGEVTAETEPCEPNRVEDVPTEKQLAKVSNGRTTVFVPTATLQRNFPKTSVPSKNRSSAGNSTTHPDQKRSRKQKSHRNVVDYDCQRCGLRTRFQGSDHVLPKVRNGSSVSKKHKPVVSDANITGPSLPPKSSPISTIPTSSGSASASSGAHKRKKTPAGNSLLSMVAKNRKEDEARKQNGDSPGGGLLAGFLSSL